MNRIFVPTVTFRNIVSDESRTITAYSKLFEIARRNIIEKRQLTSKMSEKYTKV